MFHPASSRLHTSLKSSALARQMLLGYKMRPMCGVQSARVRQMEKEIDEGAGGGMECKTCVPSGSSARLSERGRRGLWVGLLCGCAHEFDAQIMRCCGEDERGNFGKKKRKKKRKEAWCITLTAPLLAAHASRYLQAHAYVVRT